MDNCPQQWPYGHTKRTESLSDIYLTVICGGDGGASRARQRVKLDGDRGINCHDVVYPSQRRQRLPCGVLPPLASWPVIGFLPLCLFCWASARSFGCHFTPKRRRSRQGPGEGHRAPLSQGGHPLRWRLTHGARIAVVIEQRMSAAPEVAHEDPSRGRRRACHGLARPVA